MSSWHLPNAMLNGSVSMAPMYVTRAAPAASKRVAVLETATLRAADRYNPTRKDSRLSCFRLHVRM
eukprot:8117261-Pyramimonas_sp.AAC.1